MLAAAQYGKHGNNRSSYGHAMIIDPWGYVVAQCSNKTAAHLVLHEIDNDYQDQVRNSMPVFDHRREDIYCKDPKIFTDY